MCILDCFTVQCLTGFSTLHTCQLKLFNHIIIVSFNNVQRLTGFATLYTYKLNLHILQITK